jgi:hypothetical protein
MFNHDKENINRVRVALRITGLYMYAACRRLGYEKPQSGYALCVVFSPPQFCNPAKPSISLIRVAKSSYTTGTLGAIPADMIQNIDRK